MFQALKTAAMFCPVMRESRSAHWSRFSASLLGRSLLLSVRYSAKSFSKACQP